jgi:hypothetical protein
MQTRHVASHGANHCLVAFGYRHPVPPEQREVSQVCHYRVNYCSEFNLQVCGKAHKLNLVL